MRFFEKANTQANLKSSGLFILAIVFIFFVLALFPNLVFAKDCRQYRIDQSIDVAQLWQDITTLSSDKMLGRKTQTAGAQLAREYLRSRFHELGLLSFNNQSGNYFTPFTYPKLFAEVEGTNVMAYLPGEVNRDKYIVISAHYDHLGKLGNTIYNGADDNASGVAALLAIAKSITQSPTQHSIIFLATDSEETGLYGAKAFVRNPPVDLSQIVYNLNLDMLSQGGRRNRLYVSGASSQNGLKTVVDRAIKSAGLCLQANHSSAVRAYSSNVSKVDWRNASDHAAFKRANIPYLFVGVSDHRFYHTQNDNITNIDREFHVAATEASLHLLRLMDEINKP